MLALSLIDNDSVSLMDSARPLRALRTALMMHHAILLFDSVDNDGRHTQSPVIDVVIIPY